tara:strand:+ start:408 stop:1145 length:738 start_codon:yes stop_codon:yes gene_type:complete
MTDDDTDALASSNLLKPRSGLPWKAGKRRIGGWPVSAFINCPAAREHQEKLLREERAVRAALRDSIEGELASLPAVQARFWFGEYRFIEKRLSFHQLTFYAPAFLCLARLMPRKMVVCRRLVVRKYLEQGNLPQSRFIARLCRQFVRSSVLIHPDERLFAAADQFIGMARRSADQTRAGNRFRLAMLLRTLHLMSDQEICARYQTEDDYLRELSLLGALVRYYRLTAEDVFRLSAADIRSFWKKT